ncbi:MAG TPA: PEGA domain-containing protein, partial [Polyangia bacterium]|nr:PEGA domain-containing protein [Polyangia bacterium]
RAYLFLSTVYDRLQRTEDAKQALESCLKLDRHYTRCNQARKVLNGQGGASATRLKLTTEPSGATVFLDLKAAGARGKTPLELPVSPGRHRVFFELDAYEPLVVKNVEVKEGQEVAVHRELVIKGCDMTVAVTPARARGRLDGQKEIAATGTVRVSPGEHTIEWSGTDVVSKTVTVTCEEYRPFSVVEALKEIDDDMKRQKQLAEQIRVEAKRQARLSKRQRPWLGVGIAAAALALGAEGLALASRFQGNRVAFGSPEYNRFRTIEVASQIGAGALAALTAGSFVAYGVLDRRKETPPYMAPNARLRLHSPRFGALFLPGGAGLFYGARF